MKRKESMAVYHPSCFLQALFQTLVIFALFGIGFTEIESQENKEATSADSISAMSTTTMALPPISIPINQKEYEKEYVSLDEEAIKFELYPPTNKECVKDDKMKASFELSIAGCESLVIGWTYNDARGHIEAEAYYPKTKIAKKIAYVSDKASEDEKDNKLEMFIERKGDKKVTYFTKGKKSKAITDCKADISDPSKPFKLSYSAERTDCGMKIELKNAYTYTTTTSTTPSTTTTSATTSSGSTTTNAATSSSAPTTSTQNTIIGLAPLSFGLIFGGIGLLLVLLVAGLLLYFLRWRKRGTDKEEEKENEKPRPPGISPETMAKLYAMKPKVFPLTEKQKQIKAGAMAEEDEYPTEVSDDSGFGPVQSDPSDPDSRKKKSESTSDQSSKTDSKRRSSKNKSTKKKNGNTP